MAPDVNRTGIFLFLLTSFVNTILGEVVVQTSSFCSVCTFKEEYCRNPPYVNTQYMFLNKETDDVIASNGQTYEDGRNCIVSIIAKPNHQITVQLNSLSVDENAVKDDNGLPKKCYDYIKLFNGPTVDNARMFPQIPPSGICGQIRTQSDLPTLRVFKTSQNYLTIQFVTDSLKQKLGGGFSMRIDQSPYSNAGNLLPTGGNLGGWNDGSYNVFLVYWNQLNVIPSGIYPGTGGEDYGVEEGGVECYTCTSCAVEPFDPEIYGISTRKGCHICSKEWDNSYAVARRQCYSLTDYTYLLESLSQGLDEVTSYTGCKQFITQYGRTVNYCFCREDDCNSSVNISPGYFGFLMMIFVQLYIRLSV